MKTYLFYLKSGAADFWEVQKSCEKPLHWVLAWFIGPPTVIVGSLVLTILNYLGIYR